jgi:hypothetical protein
LSRHQCYEDRCVIARLGLVDDYTATHTSYCPIISEPRVATIVGSLLLRRLKAAGAEKIVLSPPLTTSREQTHFWSSSSLVADPKLLCEAQSGSLRSQKNSPFGDQPRRRANNQDLSKIIFPYASQLVTREAGLCDDTMIV